MPSLLIVDDLVSIHEMLGAVIQPIGYELAFATDGEKGLATYKAGKFDVVLADAPCSGSGTWRRRPDAKWRVRPANLAQRQEQQRRHERRQSLQQP